MSSEDPPNPGKGKEVAKPKAKKAPKRPRYLIKVPPARPSTSTPSTVADIHSAALQPTSLGVAPTPLPSPFVPIIEATPPPVMVPTPPLVMVPTPPPVMVPTPLSPLVPTPPSVMVPTPPSVMVPTPSPMMVPMPPPVVLPQPSSSPSTIAIPSPSSVP
ncbi:classical arabinogalactan protein 9-like [Vigna unguiculata]|uniref:classical arabinogalactan protein 9-like n=1 Tax=Vigna unguiculata TaxID=3917 RepID=UPI00101627B6|nr:classical arabinogalactan protein 9-like [Vigna unguiculata]